MVFLAYFPFRPFKRLERIKISHIANPIDQTRIYALGAIISIFLTQENKKLPKIRKIIGFISPSYPQNENLKFSSIFYYA